MKKLPKEKRNRLVLVAIMTVFVLAGLWMGLISFQKKKIEETSRKIDAAEQKLKKVRAAIDSADKIEAELEAATEKLATIEETMASGDRFAWFLRTINQFKVAYKVDMPQLSQPLEGDMQVLPRFPYKQAAFTVIGSAHYHEFGKFIADFENQFPYARVQNLELYPDTSATGGGEKLAFKMDIVALIKPTAL